MNYKSSGARLCPQKQSQREIGWHLPVHPWLKVFGQVSPQRD